MILEDWQLDELRDQADRFDDPATLVLLDRVQGRRPNPRARKLVHPRNLARIDALTDDEVRAEIAEMLTDDPTCSECGADLTTGPAVHECDNREPVGDAGVATYEEEVTW